MMNRPLIVNGSELAILFNEHGAETQANSRIPSGNHAQGYP